MATNYKELKRLTLLGFPNLTGDLQLIVEQAINDAHKCIARSEDFPELMVWDITNAFTVASQKRYHLETDLHLVRPKDIYSIKLMDTGSSRKLRQLNEQDLDRWIPYPESAGTGRSDYYIQFGEYLELYKIPGYAYPLYIRHSQWPAVLALDGDVTPYLHIDDVIVQLSKEITMGYVNQTLTDFTPRAKVLLKGAVAEDRSKPDMFPIAQGFRQGPLPLGEYWKDPFIKQTRGS